MVRLLVRRSGVRRDHAGGAVCVSGASVTWAELPLLRDLPPLSAVIRCDVCNRLCLSRELCLTTAEAIDCMAEDVLIRAGVTERLDLWQPGQKP